MALLGIGGLGIGYYMMKGYSASRTAQNDNVDWANATFSGTGQTANRYNPVVQARVQSSLGYFGAGLSISGLTMALARGSRFAYMNPLWFLIPTLGSLFGMMACDY